MLAERRFDCRSITMAHVAVPAQRQRHSQHAHAAVTADAAPVSRRRHADLVILLRHQRLRQSLKKR